MSKCMGQLCVIALLMIVAAAYAAPAQMTIFNVPSTDVLPKKSAYIEADVITKPIKYSEGGFQTYGWRVVYGVGGKTELGANVYLTRDGLGTAGDLQFSVKRTIYADERTNFAWTAGVIASTPIKDERGSKPYAFLYTNASKVINKLNGLRVTGGAYTVVGGGRDFGTKTGAIIGVEQPIRGRLSFIGDWASGNNRLGYVSGGLNWAITKRQFILAGYSVGSSGRGNNYLSIFYGYTF
jgi:hypothetical protein